MPDTPETLPPPHTRAEQQAEAFRIAANSVRLTSEALAAVTVAEWTQEEKDGVLFYLEDTAKVWMQRANGCGRF